MRKRRSGKKRIIAAIVLLVLVAAFVAGGKYWSDSRDRSEEKSEQVLATMKNLIPGLGVSKEPSGSPGRDPLPAMSIEKIDIVGCIEIPALNIMAPVTAKGYDNDYFITFVKGSPAKGQLRLTGGRSDVFQKLTKGNPGDKVIFTDVDGVRYVYIVTTQYHLKDWAKADNDLLLTYEVDDKTDFVLGCDFEE